MGYEKSLRGKQTKGDMTLLHKPNNEVLQYIINNKYYLKADSSPF